MHIYIKNSNQCTKQLLELIREFNDIAAYKDNIHESIFNIQYFYILAENKWEI